MHNRIEYIVSVYILLTFSLVHHLGLHSKTTHTTKSILFGYSLEVQTRLVARATEIFESETNASALLKRPAKSIDRREARDSRLYDSLYKSENVISSPRFPLLFVRVPRFLAALITYRIPRCTRHAMSCVSLPFSRDFPRKVRLARGTSDQLLGMRDEHPLPVALFVKTCEIDN